MRKAYIMRGLPGSGKTTYAWKCFSHACILSADDYFMDNGVYKFVPQFIGKAHESCFRRFISIVQRGISDVVVDNTNISAWEMAPYIMGASAFGYSPSIVELKASAELALARNVHEVPEDVIRSMQDRLENEVIPPFWPRAEAVMPVTEA